MQPISLKILQQAQTAADRDWASVNHHLQQLLGDESLTSPAAVPPHLLTLALQSLESGDFQDRWDVAKLFPSFGDTFCFTAHKKVMANNNINQTL
ncbi:MAG: hypothetical protein LH660_21820 [Phormidesmis sp. CAN_BIN36]|nr:hypothetical protein [Phormidesmis sp. CAN_BIN36]